MIEFTAWLKNHTTHLLLLLVIISGLLGLWMRLLPMEYVSAGPVQKVLFMDSWYSMRQIEQITANYPGYAWFDPMTAYPGGKEVDWGPLFPFLCATVCMIFGAVARPDSMIIASFVPPVLFLFLIPTIWYLGRLVGGEKTGWIAAILLPVISGEFLYRSFYSYLDHHITEALFGALFMTLFIALLVRLSHQNENYTRASLALAAGAGISYFFGIMNMPTMALFAAITAIIILLHAVWTRDENELIRLLIHATIIFGIFALLFALLGMAHEGMHLTRYTPAHLLVALAIPGEIAVLTLITRVTKNRPFWQFGGIVTGIIAGGYLLLLGLLPSFIDQVHSAISYFFFFSYADSFINEMQMWDMTRAWYSFNIALFLALFGVIICIYRLYRSYNPALMASLVWGIVIIFATTMHLRYEYYVAVPIILFCAVTLSSLYDTVSDRREVIGGKKNRTVTSTTIPWNAILIIGTLILIIVGFSFQTVTNVTKNQIGLISMSDDWAEGLSWLGENSPDTGVNYYHIYEKDEFTYPDESYGILSWWDYGHWIMFLTKKIPISSPFQSNAAIVAKYFTAQTEEDSETSAKKTKAKYIITDYATVTSKFAALPLWAEGQEHILSFQETLYQQNPGTGRLEQLMILKQPYFLSIAPRLHIYDGSYTEGAGGMRIEVHNREMGGGIFPVITRSGQITREEAESDPGNGLVIGSIQFTRPITDLPALGSYRLIYESPTTVAADEIYTIKEVKVFERVTGHTIPGTGTIELPIITNQGREFTWRQKSVNGTFTLPYSTKNNPYDVKATGPYRIAETGEVIEVSEEQIL